MLDITELGKSIEEIGLAILIVLAVVEIVVDILNHNQRNYQDTVANIAIAVVYIFASTAAVYFIALKGLQFFSQFSLMNMETNIWTLILAVAIADFIYYWEHRVEHRIRFFWAYHSVHHSSMDYNYTVASRLSWVETCFLWIFYIPMALLGFEPMLIIIAIQITAAYQIWIHTQKIGHLGILEKTLNTPALHRVHHASNPLYIDKNFGGILMIWDRLFDTYQPETEKPIYGLTKNINTNNPIKINVIEYQRIGSYLVKLKSLKDIWSSICGSP
ncbi:MAG: sterol desaturase family protein [Spirulinaceae cyanobacterium]